MINNIVAWFVTLHSAKPADSGHPYCYRKFETFAVFSLASPIAILTFELVPHEITHETTEIVTDHLELVLMIGVTDQHCRPDMAADLGKESQTKTLGSGGLC